MSTVFVDLAWGQELRITLPDGRHIDVVITRITRSRTTGRPCCVRLGLSAERAIPIHRNEIWEAIQNACHLQQLARRHEAAGDLSPETAGPAAGTAAAGAPAPAESAGPQARRTSA